MKECPTTTLAILKSLPRTNCGDCGLSTCMAFAALVWQGQRRLEQCPHLDRAKSASLIQALSGQTPPDWTGQEVLADLLGRMGEVDLTARAGLLGGWMHEGRLHLHCLKKVFSLDAAGALHSDCHQNPWLHVPLLSYVLDGAGADPQGIWKPFSELPGTRHWVRYFEHACQDVLVELARKDTDLLLDILDLFAAETGVAGVAASRSFLLLPLPKVPMLITCEPADAEFDAAVSVAFDACVSSNLDNEGLFRLGRGIAEMARKIARRHGS